jgi:serine/threonine protein kinase
LAGSLEVAIKLFPLYLKENARAKKRFVRELIFLAKLKNDHIIQLYEPVVTEDFIAFSMEPVRGATLRKIISQGISPEKSKSITYQLLIGLECIHRKGLIRRVLK